MRKSVFYLIFCAFVFIQSFFAQSQGILPSLEPVFEITEPKEENLESLAFFEYGLLFSECKKDSQEFNKCVELYKDLEKKIMQNVSGLSIEEKAEKILLEMYEIALKNYQEKQTQIQVMMQQGTYNCVSSSILYMALAKKAGLDVRGNRTPTHAFCSVVINGQKIDVETTNPYGFNPGRKQLISQTENSAKYAVIPKKNYANRHEVGERTFVSLAGQNMCAAYIKQSNYVNAVPLSCAILRSTRYEDSYCTSLARSNFDTVCSNYVGILDKAGLYSDALLWINKIHQKYGATKVTSNLINVLVYNAGIDFIEAKNYEQADELLDFYSEYLTESNANEIKKLSFFRKLEDSINSAKNSKEAIKIIQDLYKNDLTKDKSVLQTLDNWQETYWLNEVNDVADSKGYMAAAKVAEEGILAMPKSQNLKKSKSQCLYNHDVEVHNKIVPLINAKNIKEALRIIDEGLLENPESIMLKKDREKLNAIK